LSLDDVKIDYNNRYDPLAAYDSSACSVYITFFFPSACSVYIALCED